MEDLINTESVTKESEWSTIGLLTLSFSKSQVLAVPSGPLYLPCLSQVPSTLSFSKSQVLSASSSPLYIPSFSKLQVLSFPFSPLYNIPRLSQRPRSCRPLPVPCTYRLAQYCSRSCRSLPVPCIHTWHVFLSRPAMTYAPCLSQSPRSCRSPSCPLYTYVSCLSQSPGYDLRTMSFSIARL